MDQPKYYKRTIHKLLMPSDFLQQDRSLRIYLPPDYNENESYPVIYCQDGEQFFNFGRMATQLSRLIMEEGLPPAIAVGVDVRTKTRTAEYAPDGERNAVYMRFFAEELLPYVEQRYSVRSDASGRIVAGDSLGGTVSLHLAMTYPERFSKVLSLSGAFLTPTARRIEQIPDLSYLKMYMLIGLEEDEVKTDRGVFDFLSTNRNVYGQLKERGANLHYEEKPGKHLWGFWQKELPVGLRFLLA